MWHSPDMTSEDRSRGVLLINLGTPDSPSPGDVRRYLREFLGDRRVIDIPSIPRWLLLNLVILPFRPRRAARAYAKIWTDEGSPLLSISRRLQRGVAAEFDPERSSGAKSEGVAWKTRVELAMRYGSPSIRDSLHALLEDQPDEIIILPLFPQYASASTGSALAEVFDVLSRHPVPATIRTIGSFYDHPAFIDALVETTRPLLSQFEPDHLLMSFHGLPESQILQGDAGGEHCLRTDDCCDKICAANRNCYSAHCYATARALAGALKLESGEYSVCFQSRLGRARWLDPDLVRRLPELAAQGVERLAVTCPAFVADCLETVEEVGIRAREQWHELGGKELLLLPCVNDHPTWIRGVVDLVSGATE